MTCCWVVAARGKSPVWQRELKLAKSIGPAAVPERFYDELEFIQMPGREPTAKRIARLAEALFLSE
jgi:hypothetical protein